MSKKPAKKTDKFIRKENKPTRLNKFIADAGVCSRRKADELIEQGIVKVNGKTVTELGTKVEKNAKVTVNGDPIGDKEKHIYILLNKPKDVISTVSDEKGRRTVMDIVRKKQRLYPVGRLDRNTTGVLLLTNDGELANRLMHPSFEVERAYYARLDKNIKIGHAQDMAEGVMLEDGKTAPCTVLIDPHDSSRVEVVLTEGKNREVRRMFEKFGYEVKSLDRRFYGNISARGLRRGEYRHLSKEEIKYLKGLVGMH